MNYRAIETLMSASTISQKDEILRGLHKEHSQMAYFISKNTFQSNLKLFSSVSGSMKGWKENFPSIRLIAKSSKIFLLFSRNKNSKMDNFKTKNQRGKMGNQPGSHISFEKQIFTSSKLSTITARNAWAGWIVRTSTSGEEYRRRRRTGRSRGRERSAFRDP